MARDHGVIRHGWMASRISMIGERFPEMKKKIRGGLVDWLIGRTSSAYW